MTAKFWYCPLCGYMGLHNGISRPGDGCPMCGEDLMPCWECIRTGMFDNSWCTECDSRLACIITPGYRGGGID